MGMAGVLIIIGSSLTIQTRSEFLGSIVAFIMPISFTVLIVIIRKYPKVDMLPSQFIAGISAAIIGYFIAHKLSISSHDLFLGFLAGTFQVGFVTVTFLLDMPQLFLIQYELFLLLNQ